MCEWMFYHESCPEPCKHNRTRKTNKKQREKRAFPAEQCKRTAEINLPVCFSMSAWGELEFISEKQRK